MRRAARTDHNHTNIVACLRSMGVSVVSLAAVGNGVPDLLIGVPKQNVLVEIKDGSKPPSQRKRTKAQQEFFDHWPGPVHMVKSEDEAINLVNYLRRYTLPSSR